MTHTSDGGGGSNLGSNGDGNVEMKAEPGEQSDPNRPPSLSSLSPTEIYAWAIAFSCLEDSRRGQPPRLSSWSDCDLAVVH